MREAVAIIAAQRTQEGFRIRDPRQASRPAARAERLRQLPECAPHRPKVRTTGHIAENHADNRAGPREAEVRGEAAPFVNIFPAEQQIVFFEYVLNIRLGETLADGAAMFVVHHAARLVEHLPSALPRHVAEIGIFQIEGFQQRIEAAQLEKLVAVERARSAASVETGEEIGYAGVDAVAHAQAAIFPPALRQASLLAQPGGIAEENLA